MSTNTESTEVRGRVRAAVEKNPRAMTPFIAQQLGISECEVVRHLPDGRSAELDHARCRELIEAFGGLGKVHVIVNNGAVVLEAFGEFGGFSLTGPFLNVQTESLDMHISHAKLTAAFAVIKPGHMDGMETLSFQFFTPEGTSAFKVFLSFGGQAPTPERRQQFEDLRSKFTQAPAQSPMP
jgi:putative heme iron utilization protein